MKTAEGKTSSAAKKQVQAKRESFFNKEGEGAFFSKTNEAAAPFFSPATIQPKLKIGKPNDKYEVEADAMADQVVQKLQDPSSRDVHSKKGTQDNILQAKPIGAKAIQTKCSTCEQEEQLQKKEDEISETKEEIHTKLSTADTPQPPDEEENIQTKSGNIQNEASPDLQSRINSSKGGGSPLNEDLQGTMGEAMGADFSNVRIHTGSEAVQMNKDLGAQAFTNGSDIYFNEGKYDNNSSSGKHLLAHELTHTVQQNRNLQRKPTNDKGESSATVRENSVNKTSKAFEKQIQNELDISEESPSKKNLPSAGEVENKIDTEVAKISSARNKMAIEKKELFEKNKEEQNKDKNKQDKLAQKKELNPDENPNLVQEEIQQGRVDIQDASIPVEEIASVGQKSTVSLSILQSKTKDLGVLALGKTIKQKVDGLRKISAKNASSASQVLKATGAAKKGEVRTTISNSQLQVQGIMNATGQKVNESHLTVSQEIQTSQGIAKNTNEINKETEVTRLHETIISKKQEASDVFVKADQDIQKAGLDQGNRGQHYANNLATRAIEMGRRDAAYYRRTEDDSSLGDDKAEAVIQVANRYARKLRTDGNNLKSDVQDQASEANEQVAAEKEPTISGFDNIGPEAETGVADFMNQIGGTIDESAVKGIDKVNQAKEGAQNELNNLNNATDARGISLIAEGEAQVDAGTTSGLMNSTNLAAQAGEIMDQTGEEAINQINNSLSSGQEYTASGTPEIQMQTDGGDSPQQVAQTDINQVANQLDQNEVLLDQAFNNQTNQSIDSLSEIARGSQSVGAGWVNETQQNMGNFGQTIQNGMQELPPAMNNQFEQIVTAGHEQVSGQVNQIGTDLDQNVSEIRGSVDGSVNEATNSLSLGVDEGNVHSDEVIADLQPSMDSAAESQETWFGSAVNWFSEQLADTWEAIKGMADWGFILDLAVGLIVGLVVGLAVAALLAGTVLSGGLLAAVIIGAAAGATGFAAATMSSNVRHGDPLFKDVGHALILGAFVGAGGAIAGFAGWGLLAGTGFVALSAGVGTVAANMATGREPDDHLIANMVIMGIFHAVMKPIVDRIPTGRGRATERSTPERATGERNSGRQGEGRGEIEPETGERPAGERLLETGAKDGKEPTPESIRSGEVRMEDHPNYNSTIEEIRSHGFEIESTAGDPHVSIIEVVDAQGNVIRVESSVRVRPRMRFLDLEHELGHVRQIAERFGDNRPPTQRIVERPGQNPRNSRNQQGLLTNWQNSILEYHNRLVEYLRLHERGASRELLREHAEGVEYWKGQAWKATKQGRSPSRVQWRSDHFQDLGRLQTEYNSAINQ